MTSAKEQRARPKGGKKGGAVFPRMTLKEGVRCAKRLVSKTHVSTITQDILYSGVVQAKGGRGGEKASALKQYGFLAGDTKSGFSAQPLAKQLAAAPDPELGPILKQAALLPKVFRGLFDTFHGDSITKGKLRQRAAELNVHPDMLDTCVDIYADSLQYAGLAQVDGDTVAHVVASAVAGIDQPNEEKREAPCEEERIEQGNAGDQPLAGSEAAQEQRGNAESKAETIPTTTSRTGRALIQVSINLDSSLDTDKLAKQLELLKKYGAI